MGSYRDLREEYRQIRERHLKELEERKQLVYRRLPALQQVREEIEAAAMEQLGAVLNDPFHAEEAIDAAQKRVDALKEREAALLAEHPDLAKMLQLEYDCPICKDTGMIEGRRCICLVEKMMNSGEIDLPLLRQQNFDTFDLNVFPVDAGGVPQREKMRKFRENSWKYVEDFPKNEKPNLLIYGGTGLGKTFLLSCIAKDVLEKGYDVKSYTAYRFFNRLLHYHIGKEESIEDILNADLLIVDDLGSEPEYKNVNINYFFMVLNERLCRRKHTACASNLRLGLLKERYGERIASRLFDKKTTQIFHLEGKDLRLSK